MSEIEVLTFRHGPLWNFTYLVGVAGSDAFVIDPGGDIGAVVRAAGEREMAIRHAVLTHAHHDHTQGLADLVAATAAGVLIHVDDRADVARDCGAVPTGVEDGHRLMAGPRAFELLHTPGHTEGSLCIHGAGLLFTGDTLMTGSPGRHGAFPGARELLTASVDRLVATCGAHAAVYPGHDAGPPPGEPLQSIRQRIGDGRVPGPRGH